MSLTATPIAATGQRCRVLVIDDAIEAARPILSHLSDAGFECHYAPGGIAGLATFHEVSPHLVLIDLEMPDMHGSQVCKTIRENSKVPIILLTETGSKHQPDAKIGANEYAPKSLPPESLLERIEGLLDCVYGKRLEAEELPSRVAQCTPPGWASCEACNYMGPRVKFEVMRYGESHLMCPHCKRDDSIVQSIQ